MTEEQCLFSHDEKRFGTDSVNPDAEEEEKEVEEEEVAPKAKPKAKAKRVPAGCCVPRPLACCVPRVSVPTACAIPASAVHSQGNHEPVKHGPNLKAILKTEASQRREIGQDVGPCGPQSIMPNKRRGRARYTNTTRSKPPGITDSNFKSSGGR